MTMRTRKAPSGRRRTIEQVRKDAQALDLHLQGKTYQAIADELPWMKGRSAAHQAVRRALADIQRDSLEQVDHFTAAVQRIQAGLRRCQEIIDTDHFLAAPGGKIATMTDPATGRETPVLDSGPKQRAITEMRHLNDQLIMLMDLKPPAKSRVEIITQDVVDAECEQLSKELLGAGETPGPGVIREP